MAEWLARGICNPALPGSVSTLKTTRICFTVGSLEFKSSATLVNKQLVCLRLVGILNNVMFNLNNLCQLFARPHVPLYYKHYRG